MKGIRFLLSFFLLLSLLGSSVAYADEFYRLKNRWTGDFMHIENKNGYVQLSPKLVSGGMWSAQWETVPVDNYVRLKNRWTGDFMHIENKQGKVQTSPKLVSGGMWSAQWTFEKVKSTSEKVKSPSLSSKISSISGKGCLDINMSDPVGSGGKGRNIIVWPRCHGGKNQQWTLSENKLINQSIKR